MKKLNIEITNARILGYEVKFDEEGAEPIVSVTVGLYTDGGKQITTYTVANKKYWGTGEPFTLPLAAATPILGVAAVLEQVVTQHCKDAQKVIEASNES